jgi:hypothetical protein
MSIASEITRLQGVKSDILQAISDKGVVVPAGSALDDCPDLIASIPTGGGNIPDGYKLTMYTELAYNSGATIIMYPKYYGQDDITPYRYDSLEYQVYLKQNVSNPSVALGFSAYPGSGGQFKYLRLSANITPGSESIQCEFRMRNYFDNTLTLSGTAEGFVVAKMSYDGTDAHYALNDITDSKTDTANNNAIPDGPWQLFNVGADEFAGTKIFRMRSKIYNSDKYRFDYVPARRISDNRAGFINLVTGNFVWSKDTPTNLVAGPDIT